MTISETSMTVTASASTSVPKGSPTRSAMTSAWWTATKTEATRPASTIATNAQSSGRPQTAASRKMAIAGTAMLQIGVPSTVRLSTLSATGGHAAPTARFNAARASRRVESRVGSAEFESSMISGISVQPRITASAPAPFSRSITCW